MEIVQLADGLRFAETELAWWMAALTLLVPALIGGGALYHVFFKSDGPLERAFYFGFVLFSIPFALIPWIAQASYSGLSITLDGASETVVFADDRSSEGYSLPFADFSGYSIGVEQEQDSEGRTDATYTLYLTHARGLSTQLYRTGDREGMQGALQQARAILPLSVTDGLADAFDVAAQQAPTTPRMPAPEECAAGFANITGTALPGGGCELRWPARTHPALSIGILLPIIAIYFVVVLWKARGFQIAWPIVGGIAVLLLLAVGYATLRSWNSVSVLRFSAEEQSVGAYLQSPYFGRFDERELPMEDAQFFIATIGAGDTAFQIMNRNPFAGGADLVALFGQAMRLRSLAVYVDGLPVGDQLRLAELLASASLDW